MTDEELKRVKACRKNPKMKQSDVSNEADTTIHIAAVPRTQWRAAAPAKDIPGWTHKDSGVVFRSRSALKKAIRIAWSKPNALRVPNRDRFHRSISQIIRANDMSIPEMVRAEVVRVIAASHTSGAMQEFIRVSVDTEVRKMLGTGTQVEAKIKAYAEAEVKRLVLDSLHLDFAIKGDGQMKTGRALRLTSADD